MANEYTAFWLALLDQGRDTDQRTRLWNGYLGWKLPPRIKGEGEPQEGWPKLIVHPPDGGWPKLTTEEHEILETLAKEHGGHPEWTKPPYMNFSDHTFLDKVDFSGLILIDSHFDNARFEGEAEFSDKTQFYAQAWFHEATFKENLYCNNTRFDAPVYFDGSCFKQGAYFFSTEFRGWSLIHQCHV